MKTSRFQFKVKGIFLVILHFHFFSHVNGSRRITPTSGCVLPAQWSGSWSRGDLSDAASPVVINGSIISVENLVTTICLDSLPDSSYYLFKEKDETGIHPLCYRCLFILERHSNVIQYRQSECEDQATFDDCMDISTSNPFISLFRIDAKRELCPFVERKMTFDYSTEGRVCSYEASGSHADACPEFGMLSLNYEACVDVTGSEKFGEELICVGSWQENSYNYFIGKVIRLDHGRREEAFRCFSYAEVRPNKTSTEVTGYQVSRSGDTGSCAHAMHPTDGSLTYTFQIQQEKYAKFPEWLDPDQKGESRWTAMNLTFEFGIDAAGGKMQILPRQQNLIGFPSYQFTASKIENVTETYATIEVMEIVGCRRLPICMDLYKRSEAVVEIELYHRTNESDLSTSCHHRAKVDPHITYTLVKMRPSPVGCPLSLSGVFLLNVPLLSSHKSHVGKCAPESEEDENPNRQHFLEIGCSRRGSGLDFYSACNHGQPLVPTKGLQLVSALDCISSWTEGGKTYIVANNSRFGVPGYRCLEVTQNKDAQHSVFVSLDDCKPSSEQRLINWTFHAKHSSGCDYEQEKWGVELKSSAAGNIQKISFVIWWMMIINSIFFYSC